MPLELEEVIAGKALRFLVAPTDQIQSIHLRSVALATDCARFCQLVQMSEEDMLPMLPESLVVSREAPHLNPIFLEIRMALFNEYKRITGHTPIVGLCNDASEGLLLGVELELRLQTVIKEILLGNSTVEIWEAKFKALETDPPTLWIAGGDKPDIVFPTPEHAEEIRSLVAKVYGVLPGTPNKDVQLQFDEWNEAIDLLVALYPEVKGLAEAFQEIEAAVARLGRKTPAKRKLTLH